jgi:hypothetical protein
MTVTLFLLIAGAVCFGLEIIRSLGAHVGRISWLALGLLLWILTLVIAAWPA